ncbi:MAG: hypothetical protein WD069_03615 [Planctomycetales bacterium]
MTRSRESGENEITREAKAEAKRKKRHACEILAEMLARAKAAGDSERVRKIIRAQKYLGCRNVRKRKDKP